MPELPEVETTRRGLAPWVQNQRILSMDVRQPQLRWPIPSRIAALAGATLLDIERRAKYLRFVTDQGRFVVHLGMSGSLRVETTPSLPRKHDHVVMQLEQARVLYHDPRRFGYWLWEDEATVARLLTPLGPEPLGPDFHADYLFRATRKRRVPIKQVLMDAKVVVGIGNIYASESLYEAGVRPQRPAQRVTRAECERIVAASQRILQHSIAMGGTTLRDFVNSDGQPGYFAQTLRVYANAGEPCSHCAAGIRSLIIAQRNSFYCPKCQT